MSDLSRQKVRADHLARKAYLYVRQSSLQQVLHNTESADRQYALRQRATALGWREEDIITVDCDTGQSGASAADREGFQMLVAEVGLGNAGNRQNHYFLGAAFAVLLPQPAGMEKRKHLPPSPSIVCKTKCLLSGEKGEAP